MSQPSQTRSPASSEASSRAFLVEDLERRIEQLETLGDSELGNFTAWDWWICVLGSVVLPAIALWWFA